MCPEWRRPRRTDSTGRRFRAKQRGERGKAFAIVNGAASGERDGRTSPAQGLFLLFAKGTLPSREQVLAGIGASSRIMVSHDPASGPSSPIAGGEGVAADRPDGDNWLELLVDGMTFDLRGLAAGERLSRPAIAHRFAIPAQIEGASVEVLGILPGPHIADGAHTLPVVRTHLALGAELSEQIPGVAALCWAPARTAMGKPYFARAVESWLKGGPFPALGLTGIAAPADGSLRSEGLAFLTGQEIELAPDLSVNRIAATRLYVRIVHELVALGKLAHPLEMTVEGAGPLLLDPRPDEGSIRISSM